MLEKGFSKPTSNYFGVPHEFINIMSNISNMSEIKILLYLIRHTWGFQEYDLPKYLTVDEFMQGRVVGKDVGEIKNYPNRHGKYRMDAGTGLSEMSVRNGLTSAISDGYIIEYADTRDKARVKKYYLLRIAGKKVYSTYLSAALTDRCTEILNSIGYKKDTKGNYQLNIGVQELDPQDVGGTNTIPQNAGVQELDPKKNVGYKTYTPGVQNLDPRGIKLRPRTEKILIKKLKIKNNHSFNRSVSITEKCKTDKLNNDDKRTEEIKSIVIERPKINEDIEEVKEYFFKNVSEDNEIIPFLQKWVSDVGKDTVLYCINRLLEQKKVGNVISWLEKAVKNPEKYPKKIEYKSRDKLEVANDKKRLMRSMYS